MAMPSIIKTVVAEDMRGESVVSQLCFMYPYNSSGVDSKNTPYEVHVVGVVICPCVYKVD